MPVYCPQDQEVKVSLQSINELSNVDIANLDYWYEHEGFFHGSFTKWLGEFLERTRNATPGQEVERFSQEPHVYPFPVWEVFDFPRVLLAAACLDAAYPTSFSRRVLRQISCMAAVALNRHRTMEFGECNADKNFGLHPFEAMSDDIRF